MANFDKFLEKILKLEGGYVNHPNDLGGCTNHGITLTTYQHYFGENLTCKDLKNISENEVGEIYKDGYWDKCLGDNIENESVAEIIVDWAVNSGVKTAVKNVQKLVNTTPDGAMGKITLKAINDAPQEDLFNEIKKSREEFYQNIVKKNPTQKCFLKGWINRINEYNFELNS